MVIAIDPALAKGGGMLHLFKSQRESSASTACRPGFRHSRLRQAIGSLTAGVAATAMPLRTHAEVH
jgi:hypothetical protein